MNDGNVSKKAQVGRTRLLGRTVAAMGVVLALLAGGVAYASAPKGGFGPIHDGDVLDMSGDWVLTYGYRPGLSVVGGYNFPDPTTARSYPVHIDVLGATPFGQSFSGYYTGPEYVGHPLSLPGALSGQTYYADRGAYTLQMVDKSEPHQYFALLSGSHKIYPAEPGRTEIAGGWVDIGGYICNFTLVKVPGSA